MWLLNAAIFFALFAFSLNNQEPVTLHLFFGVQWQAPLVLVLLCVLVMGVFLGVLVMLPLWLRARKTRRLTVSTTTTASGWAGDSTFWSNPPDIPGHGP